MNDLAEEIAFESLPAPESMIETPQASALPAIIDSTEFIAEEMTPPRELVEGILHQGSKMSLGGGSKTFKTWTLLDLAVSVATGQPWLEFRTAKGRVLFLNFEIQPVFFQSRIQAISQAKGVTLAKGQLDLWNLRGHATTYHLILPQICERVKEAGYVLIVLDPIYKLYGNTDENSAGQVAQLLNALESLAVDTGAAIAFGAHYSKGNQSAKEAIDRISGSSVFGRDPDSILNFTRHETDDCFSVEAILRNIKPLAPFVVRWEYPLMRPDGSLDPTKLKQAAGRKPKYDVGKLLTAIADTTREKPMSIKAWADAGNVPRQTLTDYLPEMRRNGWIETTGEGNNARQYLTDKGRGFLTEATCRK